MVILGDLPSKCIVWVGNIMTPVIQGGPKKTSKSNSCFLGREKMERNNDELHNSSFLEGPIADS